MSGNTVVAAVALAAVCLGSGVQAARLQVRGRLVRSAIAKMTAASAYLLFAYLLGANESSYGRLVLVALGLSWFGDLFLALRGGRTFLAGLAGFLLAHVAYAGAFAVRGVGAGPALAGAAAMGIVGGLVLRWLLRAGLPRPMRMPIVLYLVAIGVMVGLAAGTTFAAGGGAVTGSETLGAGSVGAAGPVAALTTFAGGVVPAGHPGALPAWTIFLGAVLFAASDILVARQRFVREQALNRLVGLPLYFAAQLLLAASVA